MTAFLTEHISYLGIIIFLVLTGCGLPIPEEVPIVLAGVFSANGELVPQWAFLACLVGALMGDSVMYAIGYHFGHGLIAKHPHFGKFVGAQREEYFEKAIQKHSFKVLLLARFMIGVRGPVYLAAGVVRMPFRKFLMYDLVCATLVVGTFFGVSYFFGAKITEWITDAERTLTLVVLALAGCAFLWWRRRRRNQLVEEAIEHEEIPENWPDRHAEHEQDSAGESTDLHDKSA